MYKLKNSYIDRMVQSKLSSREIDFILYLARIQDDYGWIHCVYYKDVCEAISISVQKFYDIMRSLQQKGLILYEKSGQVDYRICLTDNDFSNNDFTCGYLKVSEHDFQSEKFTALKAGSKLLYLYMQRFTKGKHMLVQNFYEEFCRLFQRKRKSIQIYIHELKKNFLLFISKKRNKAYNYEMTMKNSTVLMFDKVRVPHEKSGYFDNIKRLININFSNAMPEKNADRVVNDIISMMDSKKSERYKNFVKLLKQAITDSLDQQRNEGKPRPVLNAALINRYLTRSLGMQPL